MHGENNRKLVQLCSFLKFATFAMFASIRWNNHLSICKTESAKSSQTTRLHGVTSQKSATLIVPAAMTSDLTMSVAEYK